MPRLILAYLFPLTLCGCLATNPPYVDYDGNIVRRSSEKRVPDTPDDIERMLRQQREPILDDILDQDDTYRRRRNESSVAIGMPKRHVQMSLGSPQQVEVAGNPKYGNERWTYEGSIPTSNGYVTERKYIYFENHQVVGWEID